MEHVIPHRPTPDIHKPRVEEATSLPDDFGVSELFPKVVRQSRWSHLLHLPYSYLMIGIFKFIGLYTIKDIKNVRKQFRQIIKENRGTPMMICGNHLTYADSAILIWALAPMHWYFFNYKAFSWNLPAGDHFKKKFIFRLIAVLSKCIFIHRDGSKEHHAAILNTARELLKSGHLVTIFPEGKRSRSGIVDLDKLSFGIGKIISKMDRCKVLCFYLRSDKQKGYSSYPPRGSKFYVDLKLIEPKSNRQGRDAYFDIVTDIGKTVKSMEDRYFSGHQ